MTNSSNNSVRFVKDGMALQPYLTVGNYEFKMTHLVMDNPKEIYQFLREVGVLKNG